MKIHYKKPCNVRIDTGGCGISALKNCNKELYSCVRNDINDINGINTVDIPLGSRGEKEMDLLKLLPAL